MKFLRIIIGAASAFLGLSFYFLSLDQLVVDFAMEGNYDFKKIQEEYIGGFFTSIIGLIILFFRKRFQGRDIPKILRTILGLVVILLGVSFLILSLGQLEQTKYVHGNYHFNEVKEWLFASILCTTVGFIVLFFRKKSKDSLVSGEKRQNIIMKHIIAPIIVGLVLGFVAYIINGEFMVVSGIALIGSVVTFTLKS